jgi:hypothetical protein
MAGLGKKEEGIYLEGSRRQVLRRKFKEDSLEESERRLWEERRRQIA